jgi:hypothetical protein
LALASTGPRSSTWWPWAGPARGAPDPPHRAHPGRVTDLLADIVRLEPDPAEVRVVLETRHGMLVERLVDTGVTVLPVNPELVARRRGPAKKRTTLRCPHLLPAGA